MPAFLSESAIATIKDKINRRQWARAIQSSLMQEADSWLAAPLPIPEGETGWWHNYLDPRNGMRLQYDPAKPHEHVSPLDGKVFSGGDYDAAWRYQTHLRIARAAERLALVYRLSGGEEYGRAAADILYQYARRYPSTKPQGRWAGKGRIMGQSLDEAGWAIALLRAYDLLAGAGLLPAGWRQTIANDLFLPVAALLQAQTNQVHNIHSWHNAAIIMVGLVTDTPALVDFALNDPRSGFVTQVAQGVMDDGFWWEGSTVYHFYTMTAFQHLIGALRAAGRAVPAEERVRHMYLAPVLFADPERCFPALNDSSLGMSLLSQVTHYEVAAGWWDDARFMALLQEAYGKRGMARASLEALLYGPVDVPDVEDTAAAPLASHNFAASGIGVLRRADHYALVKYGPHGGGHGHPDKLAFMLHSRGETLSADLGTPGYGVPLHAGWYKRTISHNTLLVDERQQQPATGELRAFVTGERFDAISVAVTSAYPGVELQRTLVLTADLAVVVDRATAAGNHTYDWVYHSEGEWDQAAFIGLAPAPCEAPFQGPGYEHLTQVHQAAPEGSWRVGWLTPAGRKYSLWMAGQPDTQVFLAKGPANPAHTSLPFLLVRRRGAAATWAGVFDLSGRDDVQAITLLTPDTAAAVQSGIGQGETGVEVTGTRDTFVVIVDAAGAVRLA